MQSFTREEAVDLHRKMWNYIADETKKRGYCVRKRDALEHFGYNADLVRWHCPCCSYAYEESNESFTKRCLYCPLEWPGGSCISGASGGEYLGLFDLWEQAVSEYDRYLALELARRIANLPERREEAE